MNGKRGQVTATIELLQERLDRTDQDLANLSKEGWEVYAVLQNGAADKIFFLRN